ncbi:MAG: hypothetical protein ACRC30_04260 [Clostridium sp.]
MINLSIRNSTTTSIFKKNLLTIASSPGDVLIIGSGYLIKDVHENLFQTFLKDLVSSVISSHTRKIYIVAGQFSTPFNTKLSHSENEAIFAEEREKISEKLNEIANAIDLETLDPCSYSIDVVPLYSERFHAKIAIKANSNSSICSILLGSSNLTKSSILEGDNLSYYSTESDILLTNIDSSDTTFITFNDNLTLDEFLKLINPSINFDYDNIAFSTYID